MPDIIASNFRLKLLAVVLTLAMWGAVAYSSNPPGLITVSVSVPQSPASIPSTWILMAPVLPVHVEVTGAQSDLNGFRVSDIVATADYGAIRHAGVQEIPLSLVNYDNAVQLYQPPKVVQVDVEPMGSKQIPVTVVVAQPPPSGFHVQTATASPATIVISGPSGQLSRVVASAPVVLSNQKANLVEDVPVRLTIDGRPVGDMSESPPTVQVTVTIVSANTTRLLGVVPSLGGTLRAGLQLQSISLTPAAVTVFGPETILNALTSLSTSPINLSSLAVGSQRASLSISLPAGVTLVTSTGSQSSSGTVIVTIVVGQIVVPASPTPTPVPSPSPVSSPSPTAGSGAGPTATP